MWNTVPGFEFIEITRDGRVRKAACTIERIDRWGNIQSYNFKTRELRTWIDDNGYVRCVVQRNGRRGPIYVHRLIAMVFVDGYQTGYHVNHINGIKTDNRPENLEWVPNDANVRHAWKTGLTNVGPHNNPASVLWPAKVRAIRRAITAGLKDTTIALLSGVSRSTIKAIRDGKTWQSVQG